MLVVTSNDIPGYEVLAVYGEVFGVTVRARNVGAGFTASFRSIGGGEIPEMTTLLLQSRNEAMGRMIYQAQQRGANAITAMRFDNGEIAGRWTEICAYGTAVWVAPGQRRREATVRSAGRRRPHAPPAAVRHEHQRVRPPTEPLTGALPPKVHSCAATARG
ncbi:YbjQ family protein [Luedemannella flava]